jgi:hypothetical protein
MKPIETVYKNCRFRSRLEARWAVFFENLGIAWEYEKEGFTKDGVCYLPDFYLPETETWVEVKGTPEMLAKDGERLEAILDYGSPLPGIDESKDSRSGGLLILYEVPYLNWGFVLHPIITHHKGLHLQYAIFTQRTLKKLTFDELCLLGYLIDNDFLLYDPWDHVFQYPIETARAIKKVVDAYAAARSARFEHGEKG